MQIGIAMRVNLGGVGFERAETFDPERNSHQGGGHT